jgi:hypothetical protein
MKKKSFIGVCLLLLLLAIVALFPACKKNSEAPPMITGVRSYAASPNDTVLHSAIANGQWVVITGENLQNATSISFDGVPASFNVALFAPNSAVVQIPTIVFSAVDTTKLYTIRYATTGGATTFGFKLGPAAPTIGAISNVFANPGDSVYLYGANLVLVQHLVYGGTTIPSYKSSTDGTALGFLMPASTPTNQIVVTTKSGTAKDTINATPIITSISNENPSPGDSVYVYGTYLRNIQSFTFAGVPINSWTNTYALLGSASTIGFVMPSGAHTGPVSVTTKFGTGSTIYSVYTPTYLQNGVIQNMDGPMWTFNGMNGWWGGGQGGIDVAANDIYGWFTHTTDFDGVWGTNKTQFVFWNHGAYQANDGDWTNSGTRLSANQWVPVANLSDDPGHWAVKLEISIPHDWNAGSLFIETDYGGYKYRWEPWKTGIAYKTKGWTTLTIPLSAFRAKDAALGEGMGVPLTKITDLIGPTGNLQSNIYVRNATSQATSTGSYVAIDNVRIVKIK